MLKIVKKKRTRRLSRYICIVMSKRFLWIIAIFMALAMIALIIVQAYWILNAIDVKDKQFTQLVNRTMGNVGSVVQQREAIWHIMDEVGIGDGYDTLSEFTFDESSVYGHLNINITSSNEDEEYIDEQLFVYQESNTPEGKKITVVSEDSVLHLRKGQLAGFDTTITKSITWIKPSKLRAKVEQQLENNRMFIDKIVSQMVRPEFPFEERMDPEILRGIIHRELVNNGIDLDFEFAVLNNYSQVSFQTSNYKSESEMDYFISSLRPNDIFGSPTVLSLYFPEKNSFIMKSLGFMAISSIFLTLIIILSFVLTIFVIFRQKRLSEIKNDFINNMTHELKTPISTISLASQMLNDKSIPAKGKNIDHISSVISVESKRLGYQVEKVLQMAIFDRGLLRLKLKQTDVNELIHSVINNFTIQIQKKNGLIHEELNAERSVLKIDSVHFTNVISNLIDNAIKYTGDKPEIYITTLNLDGKIIIRVKDNGIGIVKEDQKRIFEKFYRVPTGNIHNVKGFGLGLSYVKKIVEEHHGQVKLSSEIDKGTEFEICLPI